ncbi:nucleoporin protein Ndc1-Nup [Gigaspora margarita]|uniref:Nucleoporin protein Ndc1-Nup n=1 Tax=Gigaspora margarita TaxID=4874 RepID=A0A8H4ESZ4_GIGMA|nr:nucleoporin protein Ndc1-Nup [Gigaspora margarita]
MSAIPGFIYGFACGSTELSKIQKIYLLVTASCVYAIVAIFHIGCSLFQSRVDSCSQDTSTVRSFIDTTYSFVKIYVVGLLPIIATRKILIQESVRINTAPSLAEELKILFGKKRGYIVPLIYIISAVSIGSTFFDIISNDRGKKRTMLLYPGDKDFWCPIHRKDNCKSLLPTINEYYLIELIYNIILGIVCGFDFLIYKRYELIFHIVEPKNMLALHREFLALWNRKKHILVWNVVLTAVQFGVYFWIAKLFLWNTFYEWLPNLIPLNNTSIYYWMRASWFDIQLFNRTIFCGIFIIMFWSTIHLLFDHFFTRVLSTIGVFMDPHAILIDGLHANQQPYYQQIAFLELWHISKFDHDRRVAIYADFNRKQPFNCALHNNPTSAWTEISRTCMDFILGLANSAQSELKTQHRRKLEMKNKHDLFKKLTESAKKQKQLVKVGQRNLDVGVTADTLTKDREYWDMKLLEWFHPVGGNQRPFVRKLYCLMIAPLFKRSIERRTKNVFKDLHITVSNNAYGKVIARGCTWNSSK